MNRPAIQPFGKIFHMTSEEKAQRAILQQNLRAQQNSQEKAFKQDCRRTAMQLAERCTRGQDGGKTAEIEDIVLNAEIIYDWLIKYEKPMNEVLIHKIIAKRNQTNSN